MSEKDQAANCAQNQQLRVECALEAVLDLFTPMVDKWRMGAPISKLCYGLNNEHMKALDELDSLISERCAEVVEIYVGKNEDYYCIEDIAAAIRKIEVE